MRNLIRRASIAARMRTSQTVTSTPRTWVQLLSVDSQLSYARPRDFTRWVRGNDEPIRFPLQVRVAAWALFTTALPALVLAFSQLSWQPSVFYLPWFACSLLAGLWAFYEVPGHIRVTVSGFVTVGAFSTSGLAIGVLSALVAAVASWAAAPSRWERSRRYTFLANSANLVLSAAAGGMAFDLALGLPAGSDLAAKLASNRFLLAFPTGAAFYVLMNTSITALARATVERRPLATAWTECYSGMGLLFTIGILQALSFVVVFGSWGSIGPGSTGAAIAFLIILFLLGVGKQAVLQHESRDHISCMALLLGTVTHLDNRKHTLATYLLEDLLAQGTRRFLSGIPPEELTFEAEEAIVDAEIAWKLGASEQSIRSYLMMHENPQGTGPFGLQEFALPVWSPAFPDRIDKGPLLKKNGGGLRWSVSVLKQLLAAAEPCGEDPFGENRKWNRLALSGARTVHSILERYDYGRRLTSAEDLGWWSSCELAGFTEFEAPEAVRGVEGAEPQAS